MRTILILIAILGGASLLAYLVAPSMGIDKPVAAFDTLDPQGSVTALATGSKAPNFDYTTVDGKHLKLADYKGKVLLVDVFSVT
jgi:cytochrome oxidase Cu insertion factor (SCO1/SenC/PrrC family)